MTVEVFKTNVTFQNHADWLVREINKAFTGYFANFDLEDCEKILRVRSATDAVEPQPVIDLLSDFGFYAEVLCDDIMFLDEKPEMAEL